MSVSANSLQKALDDARWLLTKVQAQETAASGLEQCASELKQNLQRSNERRPPLNDNSSEGAHNNSEIDPAIPRPGVGDYFLTEKSRLQQLHKENDDLRQSLSEHQHVLEVIMVRYRQQISTLTEARRKDEASEVQERQMQDICRLATQAVTMATAMRQASGVEDELSMTEQEALAELQYEHQTLHEMLESSRPFLSPHQLQKLIDETIQVQDGRSAKPDS